MSLQAEGVHILYTFQIYFENLKHPAEFHPTIFRVKHVSDLVVVVHQDSHLF